MHHLDVEVFKFINLGWHNAGFDFLFLAFSVFALGGFQAALIIGLLATKFGRQTFWLSASSLILGGLVFADGLKQLIPRQRPSLLPYAHAYEHIYYNSFPSGQTAAPMAIAAIWIFVTSRTKYRWWGWGYLVVAALCGFSRIYRGMHYPTDVLGGIACGFLAGGLVYLIFDHFKWLPSFD